MSYHRSNMVIVAKGGRGGKKPPPVAGLGDFVDDLQDILMGGVQKLTGLHPADLSKPILDAQAKGDAAVADCLSQANAAVAQLDALIDDLSANWQPSGFYTPPQVVQIVQAGMDLLKQASDALNAAKSTAQTQDVTDTLNNELDAIQRRETQAAEVTSTLNMGVDVVEASGLRRWAIGAIQAARDGMTAASVVACLRPGWMTLVSIFVAAASVFVGVVKTLGSIVVQAGQSLQKLPDTISTMFAVLKYGALAAGAYFLYTEWQKHKSKRA